MRHRDAALHEENHRNSKSVKALFKDSRDLLRKLNFFLFFLLCVAQRLCDLRGEIAFPSFFPFKIYF